MVQKEQKIKMKNCCANCNYAKGYTGFNDFWCASCGYQQRAEQYNCESFKPKEVIEDEN